MKHDTYSEVFEEKKTAHVQLTRKLATFNKRALSAWENKHCWLSENESLPHGHMDNPVPMPKRCRVMVPVPNDVQ